MWRTLSRRASPTYVVREDLEDRGIGQQEIAKGVNLVGRGDVADLFDSHDTILALVGRPARRDFTEDVAPALAGALSVCGRAET